MARPKCCKKVVGLPGTYYYRPAGVQSGKVDDVILTLDEFEAMRLADLDGLYQEAAALKMNISRQTFGRIIVSAHRKISEALVFGKAIRIEGGSIELSGNKCIKCNKQRPLCRRAKVSCPMRIN